MVVFVRHSEGHGRWQMANVRRQTIHPLPFAISHLPFAMPLYCELALGETLIAPANLPKEIVSINPCVVPVGPVEMQGVVAHDVDAFGLDPARDKVRLDQTLMRPLIDT